MVILGFLVLVAIFAPVIAPYDPEKVLIGVEDVKKRAAPCIHLLGCPADQPQHLMGIDGNVRDHSAASSTARAFRLFIGFTTTGSRLLLGSILGAIAGYAGGWVDNVIMRLMDVLMAFPSLLLAIAIVNVLGRGLQNALLAIAIVNLPVLRPGDAGQCTLVERTRLCRSIQRVGCRTSANSVHADSAELALTADCAGNVGDRGCDPECRSALILGLGAQPPTPEWGTMLGSERNQVFSAPHLVFLPRHRHYDHRAGF